MQLLTSERAGVIKAYYYTRIPAISPTYPLSFCTHLSLSPSLTLSLLLLPLYDISTDGEASSCSPAPGTVGSLTSTRGGLPAATMNGVERHQQESLKRRWDGEGCPCSSTAVPFPTRPAGGAGGARVTVPPAPLLQGSSSSKNLLGFSPLDDEMASSVVPPVTVVLEGRSICHRIHLHKHSSYESLALALRRLFVDGGCPGNEGPSTLDLANAVPGHIVAYEDMEDDLLLAGDLNWRDFVRVAKRIRILPAKASRRKHSGGGGVA